MHILLLSLFFSSCHNSQPQEFHVNGKAKTEYDGWIPGVDWEPSGFAWEVGNQYKSK